MDRVEIKGTAYVTKHANECSGCAATPGSKLCQKLPPCGSRVRDDGHAVVWVEESE